MKASKFGLMVLLAFSMTSIGSAYPLLNGTRWELVHYQHAGKTVFLTEKMRPTLEFEISKTRSSGFTGCNTFAGTYTARGKSLKFGSLVSTRKSCDPERNRLENVYLQLLQTSNTYKLGERVLLVTSQSGSLLYRKLATN